MAAIFEHEENEKWEISSDKNIQAPKSHFITLYRYNSRFLHNFL